MASLLPMFTSGPRGLPTASDGPSAVHKTLHMHKTICAAETVDSCGLAMTRNASTCTNSLRGPKHDANDTTRANDDDQHVVSLLPMLKHCQSLRAIATAAMMDHLHDKTLL